MADTVAGVVDGAVAVAVAVSVFGPNRSYCCCCYNRLRTVWEDIDPVGVAAAAAPGDVGAVVA